MRSGSTDGDAIVEPSAGSEPGERGKPVSKLRTVRIEIPARNRKHRDQVFEVVRVGSYPEDDVIITSSFAPGAGVDEETYCSGIIVPLSRLEELIDALASFRFPIQPPPFETKYMVQRRARKKDG